MEQFIGGSILGSMITIVIMSLVMIAGDRNDREDDRVGKITKVKHIRFSKRENKCEV